MKMKKELTIMIVLALSVTARSAEKSSSGNDVYNFFFQKAPGPTTVIQGGAQKIEAKTVEPIPSQPVAAPIKEESAVAAKATAPQVEQQVEFKKWEVSAGYSQVADNLGSFKGWGVSANYNLNKYFGMGLGFVHANDSDYTNRRDAYNRSPFDFSANVILMPIHIQMFGYDLLELGLTAGFITHSKGEYTSATRTTPAYIGPRVAMNFGRNFGLVADIRTIPIDGARYGQAVAGLRMRF